MSKTWQITDLLARRDGEPHDPALFVAGDGHEQAQAQASLIKAGLQALPDVPMDEEIWAQIDAVPATTAERSGWLRYPYATAASVFLVCMLGVAAMMSASGVENGGSAQPSLVANAVSTKNDGGASGLPAVGNEGALLAGLMQRSRELEARIASDLALDSRIQGRAQTVAADSVLTRAKEQPLRREEAVILYRLADVDAQIAEHYAREEVVDTAARIALWQVRVGLLQNLVMLREGGHGAVNGFSRSM